MVSFRLLSPIACSPPCKGYGVMIPTTASKNPISYIVWQKGYIEGLWSVSREVSALCHDTFQPQSPTRYFARFIASCHDDFKWSTNYSLYNRRHLAHSMLCRTILSLSGCGAVISGVPFFQNSTSDHSNQLESWNSWNDEDHREPTVADRIEAYRATFKKQVISVMKTFNQPLKH